MDNIGGIISAEYFFAENVNSCAIIGSKIKITLPNGKSWVDFKATPGRIDISVTPSTENSPLPFTVSGTIYCARMSQDRYNELSHLNKNKLIVKYCTGNGDLLVVGDKDTPITAKVENINPSKANGYSGSKVTLSAIMKHSELVLAE